jgi:hypothetical protein
LKGKELRARISEGAEVGWKGVLGGKLL